jgi:hypothetical protein
MSRDAIEYVIGVRSRLLVALQQNPAQTIAEDRKI